MAPPLRVRLGVSACLLGERVRYDGGHKRDAFLTEVLGPHVEWVPRTSVRKASRLWPPS